MPRVFSGIQPSGELHIGNYLGAVRNWVDVQRRYESIFCIVDYHAITAPYDPADLRLRTRDLAVSLLAAGIDPDAAILFVQSSVPEHTELAWIFNTVTAVGELERQTQYKDKSQKQESVMAGLLNYPVLQAADILLYRADTVPVGEDQVQHLELSREIARRWNARFAPPDAPYFPEPAALLTPTRRIMGLDGQAKMSKSLGNTIGVVEPPASVWEKLRPAPSPIRIGCASPTLVRPRSAIFITCTELLTHQLSWTTSRSAVEVPGGAASTVSGCCSKGSNPHWPRFARGPRSSPRSPRSWMRCSATVRTRLRPSRARPWPR